MNQGPTPEDPNLFARLLGTGTGHDGLTLDDAVTRLLLVVLESLTPQERVALVLRDVFDVPFRGIGDVVGRSPDEVRRLARSARRLVRLGRSPAEAADSPDFQVVAALSAAGGAADEGAVRSLLHPQVELVVDEGVDTRPVVGTEPVAARLMSWFTGREIAVHPVNGSPGLVLRRAGQVVAVMCARIVDTAVVELWLVSNPDKLRRWNSTTP